MRFRGKNYHLQRKKYKRILFLFLTLIGAIVFVNNASASPFQDTVPPTTRIRGKVTLFEDGVPAAGVSVINVRTSRGAVTNAAGLFAIDGMPGDSIRFSFSGK